MALSEVGRDLFALRTHPGWPVHWRLVRLATACDIMQKNKKEFTRFLGDLEDFGDIEFPPTAKSRAQFQRLSTETTRLLMNFLTSTKFALNHSKRTATNYLGDRKPSRELKSNLDDLRSEDAMVFMSNLRNHIQHVSIPPYRFMVSRDGKRSRVYLRQKVLLKESKGWTGPAKRFIKDARQDIEPVALARRYATAVARVVRVVIDDCTRVEHKPLMELYRENDRVQAEGKAVGIRLENLFIQRFVDDR